jgi:Ca-activated chloride channel family protein
MRLSNPIVLLFLFAIPLFFLLRKLGIFQKKSFLLSFADWNGLSFSWKNPLISVARIFSTILCISGYICLVIALSGPVTTNQEKIFTSRGAEILFVLDTSPSMGALDIASSNRLDAAKTAISTMVKSLPGASFGLVGTGSESGLLVPPTMDHQTFLSRLIQLKIGEMGDGTALGTGISTGVYHLDSTKSQSKNIVLITDGENNAGTIHPKTAAQLAFEKGISLYILGVGTKGSVPIEYTDVNTGKVYSGYFESDFNSQVLRDLANNGNGYYYEIDSLPELISALERISSEKNVYQSYQLKVTSKYWYDEFLWCALACIALAWILRRLYLQEIL